MSDELKNAVTADLDRLACEISQVRLVIYTTLNNIDVAREETDTELNLIEMALRRLRREYETLGGVDEA
jgi:hypothetical protein